MSPENPFIWVGRSKVKAKAKSDKNVASVGLCTLVSASFFIGLQ